jgi:uncharacterized protein
LTGGERTRQDVGMNELIHPALPFVLSRDGGKGCEFALDETGTLTLTGEARSDLFVDPFSGSIDRPDAGYLLGVPPPGDFTLSARVTVPFGSMFDAGVLLVHAGPERFAKACFEFSPQRRPMAVSVVTRGVSDVVRRSRLCRTGDSARPNGG